eukprot:scaffold57410_cov43-Cyclotella_meneghiniana.AAC.1
MNKCFLFELTSVDLHHENPKTIPKIRKVLLELLTLVGLHENSQRPCQRQGEGVVKSEEVYVSIDNKSA